MAVGAEPRDVISMVLLQGLKLAVVGMALGILCAFSVVGLMKGLLFSVTAGDPLTYYLLAACYPSSRWRLVMFPRVRLYASIQSRRYDTSNSENSNKWFREGFRGE